MKKIIFLVLFSLTINIVYAQDFNFKSYVDQNNISSDDYIRFIIESNERIQLNNLKFKDFDIRQGPFTSQSSQTTIINGKFESKKEFKSTFVLIPKKEGELIIESITVNYAGKDYATEIIKINVSKGTKQITNQNSKNNNRTNNSNNKLFAKISASKSNPYIGENIILKYKIYQSVYHVRNIEITDYDLPMSNDFWTELIEPKNKQWKEEQEVINGIQYSVFTLKKEIISAQKTGKINIPSFKVSTVVNRDFFNRGIQKELKSNNVILNVKPLPKNAPQSFNGQVGRNYQLKVNVSKNNLKVDEALDINIEIAGNGNLKQLSFPKINYPQDLEQFPEEVKSKISINSKGISGKKQLSQLLIPRFHGEFEIPKIAFTYFDTFLKKYKTLSYPSSFIVVEKSDNSIQSLSTNFQKKDQQEVSIINQNIHHIKTDTYLNDFSNPFFGTFGYWSIISTIPLSLIFLLFFIDNKEKFTNKDKVLMKKVLKEINLNFRIAQQHLDSDNTDAFYSEIYKIWTNYLSNKFKINKSALNKENINENLLFAGVDQENIKSLEDILNNCEISQYSPLSNQSAQESYNQSKILFKKFEENE